MKGFVPTAAIEATARIRAANPNRHRGENNPFYGRKHTAESIEKIKSGRKELFSHPEAREAVRQSMKKTFAEGRAGICANHGKSNHQIWVEKYGIQEADRLLNETRKKHSVNNMGHGNPMYGKPSPQGAGNGWKGWYNGHFFRSLRELFFVIDYIEKNQWTWESGETAKRAIQYTDHKGTQRTYYPDYIINGSIYYEVKPKRLWNTPTVQAKIKGAAAIGVMIHLVDPEIDTSRLKNLWEEGKIRFQPKYEDRIKEYFTSV